MTAISITILLTAMANVLFAVTDNSDTLRYSVMLYWVFVFLYWALKCRDDMGKETAASNPGEDNGE